MNFTYQRDTKHCLPYNYIKKRVIKSVKPIPGAETVERINFENFGWSVVSQIGLNKVGEEKYHVPPETLLPIEFSDLVGITKFLSDGIVKGRKMVNGKVLSEGFVTGDEIEPYLEGCFQWNEPSRMANRGMETLETKDVPIGFRKFSTVPNLMNDPSLIPIGSQCYYSEKYHGESIRFGMMECPNELINKLFVGNHYHTYDLSKNEDHCVKLIKEYINNLPPNVLFYGEYYGPGIQKKWSYNLNKPELKVFATRSLGNGYNSPGLTADYCEQVGIRCVEFHKFTYEGLDQVRKFANRPSVSGAKHGSEGIVIFNNGEFIKVKNSNY